MTDDLRDAAATTARMWGLADYAGLADRLAPASTRLAATLPTPPGRVLDLAAGTGNLALAAVARGASVDAVDLSPRMVELGRARTVGHDVTWAEMDAERLTFPDALFDAALSTFGMIFAQDAERVLAEVRRVLAPGGLLGFTAWTPAGFMGAMTERMRTFMPPAGDAPDPFQWGQEPTARARLAAAGFGGIRIEVTSLPWHFDSGPAMSRFLLAHSPSHVAAAGAVGERAGEMLAAVEQLAAPDGGPVRIDAEYLLITAAAPAN